MDVENVTTRSSYQRKNQLIAFYIHRCAARESKIQFLEAQLEVISNNQ